MTATAPPEVREPSAANILALWHQTTPEQRREGEQWYAVANDLARELSPDDPRIAAGVIAATSPMTNWDRNVYLARLAFEQGHASRTIGAHIRNANKIMAGEDPLNVFHPKRAPKVRAFYKIIAGLSTEDVVIDRHAMRIAIGEWLDDVELARRYRGWYDRFVTEYKIAAAEIGIPAYKLQAATWVAYRDRLRTRRGTWNPRQPNPDQIELF